jgi:hypothetical protein
MAMLLAVTARLLAVAFWVTLVVGALVGGIRLVRRLLRAQHDATRVTIGFFHPYW